MKNSCRFHSNLLLSIAFLVTCSFSESRAQERSGTITDIEGTSYKTVTIGQQEWMAENLKTIKFNDGKEIPLEEDMTQWVRTTSPAYSFYDNDPSNQTSYGGLYNWHTVNTGKLCPEGWRVPTDDDWTELIYALGDINQFPATFGGYRYGYYWGAGIFYEAGDNGYWWTSTKCTDTHIWSRTISKKYHKIYRSYFEKNNGFSVRCIKCKEELQTLRDFDGNEYQTVQIGNQEWMTENLKTTRYSDGSPIPYVTDTTLWRNLDAPAYTWYNNDISNKESYGGLYNWHVIGEDKNICPSGWHVATDEEWKTLEIYMGMSYEQANGTVWRGTTEGDKLKEAGSEKWTHHNKAATNKSGLTVVPGGRRDSSGKFYDMKTGSTIWTSTESSQSGACYRHFSTSTAAIGRNPAGDKKFGLAVRCIKNQ
ncbi:MAG: fibrobacter succinogenes major paralogous domain-containing protein [Bacteroidota bacterium]